ncbi:hypothetical protein M404DRAFT_266768 [Pisolithus tinctorius Marx 270]|uniref:Uncharacterized protein n=1 Tax=Pisolithus tinctorius Marx 270 TaxID=870435 RepID=A0A0C3KIQ0_PISTI|nr:hypothetical protein M404DRAFT_266768 [Pisolithus tinctorius Marx 270]
MYLPLPLILPPFVDVSFQYIQLNVQAYNDHGNGRKDMTYICGWVIAMVKTCNLGHATRTHCIQVSSSEVAKE